MTYRTAEAPPSQRHTGHFCSSATLGLQSPQKHCPQQTHIAKGPASSSFDRQIGQVFSTHGSGSVGDGDSGGDGVESRLLLCAENGTVSKVVLWCPCVSICVASWPCVALSSLRCDDVVATMATAASLLADINRLS